MNKLLAITLVIVTGCITHSQETVLTEVGDNIDDGALLEHLQSGGLVLVFRHGETGPDADRADAVSGRYSLEGSRKERQAAYLDCDRQRNLSEEGRADLQTVAKAIREIDLAIGEVYSSPMCRTRETAWLLAGQVAPRESLIGPHNEERQRLVSTVPAIGGNRLLVSHGYVILSIVPDPEWPDERGQIGRGHAHVLEPLGGGEFRILAELGPDDWTRLARLAALQTN
jgi:phosphohistidine phosphatase SixA